MADSPLQPNAPLPYAPTQRNAQGYSDASIKMLREYAQALQKQKYQPPNAKYPFYGIANGLDDASAKIMGGLAMREADQKERGTINRANNYESAFQQGQPQPDVGQGGAGAAAPFPQAGLGAGSDRSSDSGETKGDSDPATAAMRLSSKGETGKDGMAALFNISRDTGGSKSYGPLGLNSKTGSVASFAKDHPELGLTAEPGTPEFDAQWRKTAATRSDDLQGAHTDWHQKNIMRGLTESMVKAGVNPAIATDPRVQTYMADRKVQMGQAGLAHALAYAKEAGSPEDFLKSVHQVDKARTPFNFPTYLKDNPNNIQGLHNRDDLRLTTALSGADPDLAKKMVDFHRNGNGVQVAQNTPLPQGQLQSELGDYIRNLGVGAQRTPAQAMELAEQALKLRGLTMPQFAVGPYGQITRTAPGEIPTITGMAPGHPGMLKHSDLTGTDVQEQYDPNIGGFTQKAIIPTVPTVGPQSQVPVPAPARMPTAPQAPQGATVQAPAVPIPTPRPAPAATSGSPQGGLLATVPPQVPAVAGTQPKAPISDVPGIAAKPGQQLALADTAGIIPAEKVIRNNLTQLVQTETQDKSKPQNFEMPAYDLANPKTTEEKNALKELNYADEHPTLPPAMRDRTAEGFARAQDPNTPPLNRIDALKNIKPSSEVDKAALEDQIKTQNKGFAELQKNYRDSQSQAVKLAPELKVAGKLLDSPDFHPGPASKLVENVRGLQEEAQRLFKTWGDDAKERGDDPSVWEKASEWIKPGHGATANQVYSKILSGSILQSLRGMLGPNAGQFRVQELKMLEQAFGNPNITLGANKAVMSMVDKINDRHILLGQMADAYLEKHRVLDPAFETAVTRFEQRNPVFKPDDFKELLNIGATGKSTAESTPSPPPNGGLLGTPAPAPYKLRPGFRLE